MFKTSVQQQLIYPVEFVIYTFVEVIYFTIFPFVWLSVYASGGQVTGYSKTEIISYYIAVTFTILFTSTYVSNQIRQDIHRGNLNHYLARPNNYLFFRFINVLAQNYISLVVAAIILIIAKFIFTINSPNSLTSLLIFAAFTVIAFLMAFFLQAILGLATFWTGENSSLRNLYYLIFSVFTGELAPLSLFPNYLKKTAELLPFKFMIYVPAQAFLKKISIPELAGLFGSALIWLVVLFLIMIFIWYKGIKTYEGKGA